VIRRILRSPSLGEFGLSLLTVFLALIVGGLAMAFTGANPLGVYKDLVVGAGFDWPFHLIPGNPLGVNALLAENNLVATLVLFTPLVLTGFAVAFAFRCGLFNIGGTGQFWGPRWGGGGGQWSWRRSPQASAARSGPVSRAGSRPTAGRTR
jgi:ABC-type uncharacterized transport system permease subunit